MKKILALLVLSASFSGFAASYGPSGCGLGSILFTDASDVLWKQVLSATSNGLSGNQTFGMTSGTSNCQMSGSLAKKVFIEANKVALSNDIARGEGQTLVSLAKLYGCTNSADFNQSLQQNYEAIFPSTQASVGHIDTNVQKVAQAHCI
ncbi:MAG: DUF3015 family protein [Bacteriovoracaceae bacterium]